MDANVIRGMARFSAPLIVTLLADDPVTQLAFSVYENPGVFALLLGSGLSRSAGIPTGWEITRDLIRRVGLAKGTAEQADWVEWYREQTGTPPNYSDLIEELGLLPEERRSILHNYIEPTEEDRSEGRKVPTKGHLAIADLVRAGFIRVIVTTNFDRLMETALRDRGIEPTVVSSADALTGAQPITHTNCYILKLHGDYKDARILNTEGELSSFPTAYDRLLDRVFDEYGLIIVGWSGEWDKGLRAAILRAPNRRYSTYWTIRGKIGDTAAEIVSARRAKVVQIADADSFFLSVSERVETLRATRVQHPDSIELLVGSAKRFLPDPIDRIRLDELCASEVARVIERIEGANLNPNPQYSGEEFTRGVRFYENATEGLSRVAGVLGRWGQESEFALVLEVIRTLHAAAKRNGMRVALRSYPAVLVFTAYGLGLTRANRWKTLHNLFSATIQGERQAAGIVDTLFLWNWEGYSLDIWRSIKGLEGRHTPLSDHLCTLMSEWARSFARPVPDFELLFARFEMLGSLFSLESSTEAEIKTVLAGPPSRPNAIRIPVGRFGWDSSRRTQLLAELRSQDGQANILKAGFAKNSAPFIDLFEANLARISDIMGWWQ